MHDCALVPHQYIANSPFVGIDKLGLGAECGQLIQKHLAFGLVVSIYLEGVACDIESLAPIYRVGPNRIPMLVRPFVEHWQLGQLLRDLLAGMTVAMPDATALNARLQFLRHRCPGGTGRGQFGGAAR